MDVRERWRIDPDRSTLSFSIGHAVLGKISGEFHCWGGVALLDKVDLQRSAVRIWVDLSSVDTGSEKRDRDILASELFDLALEPALMFDSERVVMVGVGEGVVVGRLAVHTLGKEIAVAVQANAPRRDDRGTWHLAFTARTSIDRGALGMRRNRDVSDWLGEKVMGRTIDIAAYVEVARADGPAAELPASATPAPALAGAARLVPQLDRDASR
jgi:polyisoprenoid-binding protein YceI